MPVRSPSQKTPFAAEDIMFDIKTTAKLACFAVFALVTTAAAQQPGTQPARKPGDLDAIRKVSTLIGTGVMNHTNTTIATLRDLSLARDGAVQYAILGCGGVAGVGETYTAVPYDLLGVRNDDGKWSVNLDMTTDDLKKAPTIKSENYRELLDPQWIRQVDQFVRVHGDSAHHPAAQARRSSASTAVSSGCCSPRRFAPPA